MFCVSRGCWSGRSEEEQWVCGGWYASGRAEVKVVRRGVEVGEAFVCGGNSACVERQGGSEARRKARVLQTDKR